MKTISHIFENDEWYKVSVNPSHQDLSKQVDRLTDQISVLLDRVEYLENLNLAQLKRRIENL